MNFILLLICFSAAYILSKFKLLPNNSEMGINIFIVYLSLPSIALKYVPYIDLNLDVIFPIISPLIVLVCGYIFLKTFTKIYKININKRTFGALILIIGLGNSSFMGFPLTQMYFGDEGLSIAVLYDQASFILVSTIGLFIAVKYSSDDTQINLIFFLKKIILFPAFITFIIALLFPEFIKQIDLTSITTPLSMALIPLAFFSLGAQIQKTKFNSPQFSFIIPTLLYKLILAPLIVYLIGKVLVIPTMNFNISVFEASMAPMVTAVILSNQYQLNPKLSNSILGIGIVLSIPTSYFWQIILNG